MRNGLLRLTLLAGLALPFPVMAGGVPTFDGAAIAQASAQLLQLQQTHGIEVQDLQNAIQQLQTLVDSYNTLREQVTQLERQWEGISGAKGISDLLNGALQSKARRIADSLTKVNDTLVGAGLPKGNPLSALIEEQRTTFAIEPATTIFDEKIAPVSVAAHDFATQSTVGAVAMAQYGFTRSNVLVGEIETLMTEIDATPDLKASVDLNTRMQGQVALMLAEMMKLMAAGQQMDGALANQELRAREAAFRRTRLKD